MEQVNVAAATGSLGKNQYRGRTDLTRIEISADCRRIGESCFEGCSHLREIFLPDSVVSIHKRAFAGCEALEKVRLPAGLRNIAESTFAGCLRLKQIVLPPQVERIGQKAFAGCRCLRRVEFGNLEIQISPTAFEGCIGLEFDQAMALAERFVPPLDLVIRKGASGIEDRLRTFYERTFYFDGVECRSIQSVLEAFKFEDPDRQEEICSLPSSLAYHEGQTEQAARWESSHLLYWNGTACHRDGPEYQQLLGRLFAAILEQDSQFRLDVAFLKSGTIRSKVGGSNPAKQVLTKQEYLAHLLSFVGKVPAPFIPQEKEPEKEAAAKSAPAIRPDPEAAREKARKTRKIVVMGGSFNPPTLAHQKLLQKAVDALDAQCGIFVPSSDAYLRRKMRGQPGNTMLLSEAQRLALLELICGEDPRLRVSSCEFQDDGRGHSYETMVKVQEEYPDALLFFLIGADKLKVISRWHKSREFFDRFAFALVQRDGIDPEEQIAANPMLSAYREIFRLVPEPEGVAEISSTAVRALLLQNDPSAAQMLHPKVYASLVQQGGMEMEITSFREKYHFLSNFYEADVLYQGICYRNNEAAFQAQKTLEEEERKEFASLSAAKAKRKGRQVALRPDWEEVKLSIMEEIVRAKFAQNPDLAQMLLATGERRLVEGNSWHDVFWGVDASTGEGENHLGRILMKVRQELRET